MIYNEIVKEGNELCFDVGANVGKRTEMFLNVGYKKIISIEPQLDCFSILNEKFRGNNRVVIIDKALSDSIKIEKMYIANENTISSMNVDFIGEVKKERFKNYQWDNFIEIETTTLDHIILQFGLPDFIKIDVEGYELNVLKGLSKSVNYISFEYTPELHDKSISCIEQIESISNYSYNFSLGESLEFLLNNWVGKKELSDILKTFIGKRDNNNNLIFGDIYAKKIK